MSKIQEATLEINLNSLADNYNYLRSKISGNVKFMGVVKAFSYGNNPVKIAEELSNLGADYLGVAYVKEGVQLRKAGLKLPILVIHPQPVNFQKVIDSQLTPTLYNFRSWNAFEDVLKENSQKEYPVHLNLNTGMNRLGFDSTMIAKVIKKSTATKNIKIEGIYSHFAAGDDEDEKDFTQKQIRKFINFSDKISQAHSHKIIRHLCNTSGILNYPEAHFDMVRSGIGLYGFGNSAKEDQNLAPIGNLKAPISQIYTLKKGDTVSYNRNFVALANTKIGILPLGYADGILRSLGNSKNYVLVNNEKAPIIGDICMDMIIIDITEIDCNEGDIALIFGKNKSAEDMAKTGNTISYELISGISPRIKRIFTE